MQLKPPSCKSAKSEQINVFDESAFIEGVYNNDYILVIGSGVILDREQCPDANGDINSFIVGVVNSERGRGYRSISEIKDDLSLQEVSPVYDLLVNRIEYSSQDMCPELRRLLESYLFRFVFTTTPDHYVETLMRELWGDSLMVVNFSDMRSMKEFCKALEDSRTEGYTRPTLFYVFGKAIKGNVNPTRFIESDEEAIIFIEQWMQIKKVYPPVERFLKEKRVLGIGCKYEDWYFRFFWYILTREFKRGGLYNEPFAPRINDNVVLSTDAPQLKKYLDINKVCVHTDPWAFMTRIYNMLTDTTPTSPHGRVIAEKRLAGRIFLSYKMSPDRGAAEELYREIMSAGRFNIWFDQASLWGGDLYNEEIRKAIAGTRVFIPVLTGTVAHILADYYVADTEPPYFIREWMMARETPGIKIIPVALDGYDLRGAEHQVFESIILKDSEKAPSGIDLKGDPGSEQFQRNFAKLINSIHIQLGIAHE